MDQLVNSRERMVPKCKQSSKLETLQVTAMWKFLAHEVVGDGGSLWEIKIYWDFYEKQRYENFEEYKQDAKAA